METSENPVKQSYLYALELEQGKYYVGWTTQKDPQARIKQHKNGFLAAKWTQKYRPISTLEIRDIGVVSKSEAQAQEQQLTLEYMKQYGWQNVRGGDLNYRGQYVKIGNRFFRPTDLKMLRDILVMLVLFAVAFIILLMQKK